MSEYLILMFIANGFNVLDRHIEFFCQRFIAYPINKPTFQYLSVTFGVLAYNPFVYNDF